MQHVTLPFTHKTFKICMFNAFASTMIRSFITDKPDYCNSLLYGLTGIVFDL